MSLALNQTPNHQISHREAGIDPPDIINLGTRERSFINNDRQSFKGGARQLLAELFFHKIFHEFTKLRRRDQKIFVVFLGKTQSPLGKGFRQFRERLAESGFIFFQNFRKALQAQRFSGDKQNRLQLFRKFAHFFSSSIRPKRSSCLTNKAPCFTSSNMAKNPTITSSLFLEP